MDSEEQHLLEDIHLECSEVVEVDDVLSPHCHTSYIHSLEEVQAGVQQLHTHHLVVLQKCPSFAEAGPAVEQFFQLQNTHMAWHQHGWTQVEEFLDMAFALACCLAASLEVMGLLVDLVCRKSKLLLMGASSGVALRAVAMAEVIAGAIAADTEGMVGLVPLDLLETVLAVVPP